MKHAALALGVLAGLVFAERAGASDGAADCATTPEDGARYERIYSALERGQPAAKLWWYSWTGAYATATVGQGVLAVVTRQEGTRVDSIVGAAESAIGIIGMFTAVPTTPRFAASELREMDDRTPCARVRRLRRAEKLFQKSAAEETEGRSWYTQVIGGVINLAAPAVLWIGYKRYASGWYTLGPGLAIQEAQILTQPTAAIGAWRSYEASIRKRPVVSVSFSPIPGGAAVFGTF